MKQRSKSWKSQHKNISPDIQIIGEIDGVYGPWKEIPNDFILLLTPEELKKIETGEVSDYRTFRNVSSLEVTYIPVYPLDQVNVPFLKIEDVIEGKDLPPIQYVSQKQIEMQKAIEKQNLEGGLK